MGIRNEIGKMMISTITFTFLKCNGKIISSRIKLRLPFRSPMGISSVVEEPGNGAVTSSLDSYAGLGIEFGAGIGT